MRMWKVPPKLMCRKHLLGEHLEMHMFNTSLADGKNLQGFINNGILETDYVHQRHAELVEEMEARGYNHQSPLKWPPAPFAEGKINVWEQLVELYRRCPECRKIIEQNPEEVENVRSQEHDRGHRQCSA